MGLPDGFANRLTSVTYGDRLEVYFIDRLDHIHFKLYASADRGGYHIEDLRALTPSCAELKVAAQWCMTHDVSEGFRMVLRQILKGLGYEDVANRI